MFLVAVDAYSKWPMVVVMQSTTVSKTIEALRQLFAMAGLPEQIVSDNGSQFTSEEFAVFLKANGIRHIRSAPYHPATNGLAERFVQSLKQGLKASLRSGLPLSQRLSNFLMTYRSTVHSTTGVTPSSLFLKRELRTRFDLLRPDPSVDVRRKQSQQKSDHDRHSSTRQFAVGDLVMARNFRSGPDWVPAVVAAKLGPLSYLVETDGKQLWRRHVDQLKSRSTSPVSLPQSDSENQWPDAGPDATDAGDIPTEPQSDEPGATDSPSTVPEQDTTNNDDNESSTASQDQPSLDPMELESPETPRYPRRERQTPNYYRPGV